MKNCITKNLLFFFTILIIPLSLTYGQVNQGGTPLGLQKEYKSSLSEPEFILMEKVDIEKLQQEDKVFDTIRDLPFRFGENLYVGLNPENSGTWNYLNDGSKIWQLGVTSKGAVSINLAFDRYHLPPGAKLFVYTPDGEHVIGAFTELNNQQDGYFATTLLPGDEVIIEYFEPAQPLFKGELNLWQVTHGYRGPGEFFSKGFGDAGACNINVVCPESAGWEDQIRSSAMLVTGGNGFCSGSLINNTENDGTPYFLSANHCYRNPSTVVFWFNWQSETCANPGTVPPHDAMSGAVDRGRHNTSDFWLMELNQPIPESYNVYFSGWNRSLEATIEGTVVGIHHPRADIKKFSWADGGVQAASYLGNPGSGTSHWRVGPWDGATTTEPGSSGSPIYDPQGRILGQLHGGYAACGNLLADWYGRIGVSWTGGGSDATRLSTWLDPNNTGVMAIFGFDPILDAADPQAPAAIADLNIEAGAEGELSAMLTWTNPTLTFEGEPLTQLDTIKIFRAGEIIHLITDPETGDAETYTDNTLTVAGNYIYTIRATNAFGDSPPANFTLYIGTDVPAAVSNIVLVDQDNNGFLTWDAPTEGLNGGYFLPSSVTHYNITRNPDNATFVVDAPATSLLDETIPGIGFYSYSIVPVNDIGPGGSATSDLVLLAAEGAVFMFTGTVTTCEGTFFDSGGPNDTYQNNENHTLTFFPEVDGAKINMQFIEFNTEANYDFLYVYDSDTIYPGLLVGQYSGIGVPPALADITSTHPTGALTFRFTSDMSITRPGWHAIVSCFIPADNDLAAVSVNGNSTPTVGIESIYTVTIRNTGFEPQDDYVVYLKSSDGETLSSVPGILIQPDEVLQLQLPWTPAATHEGVMGIVGEVDLVDDANTYNNVTPVITVTVFPEGIQAITIGTGDELPNYRIPFDFYWRNSLSQTIYYADELLIDEGLITGIMYYNNFVTNLPGRGVKVYIQHTDLGNMSQGFVPVNSSILVFDGNIDFPSGANEILIPLDEPFIYEGGNILITTLRTFEQQFHSSNDKFFITTTPNKPSRTVQFNSDQITIDPENPPTSGSINYRDALANTTLFYQALTEPETHTVTFHVDMSNVPYLIFHHEYDQLFMTGSMLGWAEPGTDPQNQLMTLTQTEEMIYSISMELTAGEYEYKFFINDGWDGGEWQGGPNRIAEVYGDMELHHEFAMIPGADPWQYAQVQFIHTIPESGGLPLDIHMNQRPLVNALSFRNATSYFEIPAGHDFEIELVSSDAKADRSVYSGDLYFEADQQSVIFIVSDLDINTQEYNAELVQTTGRINALQPGNTDVLIFHGSPGAPGFTINLNTDPDLILFDGIFGEFSGYHELVVDDYLLRMIEQGTGDLESYFGLQLSMMQWEDKAIVLAISGLLQPQGDESIAFGVWAALPEGGPMIELPFLTDVPYLEQSRPVMLYPNPAKEKVHILSQDAMTTLRVFDNQGRSVRAYQPAARDFSIDVSDWKTGLYFVVVQTLGGQHTLKLQVH